ncbi:NACHT domain-containing protein [Burkholderia sola]|uniref:NACHT domain-containing protein n=1 Tax=Burkholderia TaxID=32008 RepID=UPI001AE64CE6|nr:NACHT domain-containing protein [Burkholderia sp. AcTa6-5]MBP0712601.1 NACHT domain-containing protein [Burkholderia sp. AcTa6-5]
MVVATAASVATGARILAPLIKDLYDRAKKSGVNYLSRWDASQFSRKLSRKICKIESVKTLWQFDKEVRLTDFYYPATIEVEGEGRKRVRSILDIDVSPVVLEGIVGQGKSIFLRYLCIQELSENGSGRLPVFIELRSIKSGNDLMHYILQELKTYDIDATPEAFNFLAKTGKVALFFDGFDELDGSLVSGVVDELERIVERYDDIFIAITSRPDCEIQKCPPFSVIRLAKIGVEDYVPFFEKLDLPRVRANEIAAAIEGSPNEISKLIVTPLMLTLTVMVYRSEKFIPPLLAEFFESLFATVFTRHDKSKPGFERKLKTGLGERTLQKLFETFCFMCAQAELTRTLTAEEFATTYERSAKYFTEGTATVEAFRHDISKVACLLLEEGVGEMTFLHKSIAEYFAASFIRRLHDEAARKFYERARADYDRWREILNFLSKIDKYRYYSYFLIPDHEKCLDDIMGKSSGDESALRKYLDEKTKGVSLRLFDDGKAISAVTMITVHQLASRDFSFSGEEVLRRISFDTEIDPSYRNWLVEHASRYQGGKSIRRVGGEEIGEIPFAVLFSKTGYDNFINTLKVSIERMRQSIGVAREYINGENLKENIF